LHDDVAGKVTGSGVIVKPDGYILTSLHVVENPIKISVSLQDGRDLDATVVARDRYSDLALLKIDARDLPTVKFANSDTLCLGDWVVAIGDQFGLGHTVTLGLISGLKREAKGFENSFGARTGAVRFIQTDAPINRGSSGGPLVNLKGEVVGICAFIRDNAQNIGFAIPSNLAKDVAEKLTAGGMIQHPYIGIIMKEVGPELPTGPAPQDGVEVVEVKLKSPAYKAGIAPGDSIMEIDASRVNTPDEVSLAVGKRRVGDTLKVMIKRKGDQKMLNVKVEELPETD
jgi:S1-C subfamily serine protease